MSVLLTTQPLRIFADRYLGTLVVDAINRLWFTPGCARCDAPCRILRELHELGQLDRVIRLAPTYLWEAAAWYPDGRLDEEWFVGQLRCTAVPPCEITLSVPGGLL